jgi:hypothetical protein
MSTENIIGTGEYIPYLQTIKEAEEKRTSDVSYKNEAFRVNPLSEVIEPPVYCFIENSPVMTEGNFVLLTGKAKSGKTFLLGVITASLLNSSTQLNTIRGRLPESKKNVVYFDTEQSPYHVNRTVKRICSATGTANPENLYAYGIRPLSPAERVTFIETKIATIPNIGTIVIDGVRDLLSIGINDESEATAITSKFLKWSYELNCNIILLLHQNKTDMNARGHIGTELLNKAETTISVAKDSKTGVFTVSCEMSRDISFNEFGFSISENGKLEPVTIPNMADSKSSNPSTVSDAKHLEAIRKMFSTETMYSYDELVEEVSHRFSVGTGTAKKYVALYIDKEWMRKERAGMKVNYFSTFLNLN